MIGRRISHTTRLTLAVALFAVLLGLRDIAPVAAAGTTPGVVTASAGLNLRAGPSTSAAILGVLPQGTRVDVEAVEGDWTAIAVHNAAGARLGRAWVASAWVSAGEVPAATPAAPPTATAAPPTPAPAATFQRSMIGVHLIGNRGAAQPAYDAGARLFVFLGNKLEAVQFRMSHPDAVVVYRHWINTAWPSPEDMVRALAPNASDPPIIFVGLNEFDQAGGGALEIRARAAWDGEVARRIKAIQPNAEYLCGSFSHGTPDITSPEIMRAIRDYYAPLYNSGVCGFDLHNYTRGWIGQISPHWFERRWEALFTVGGFNPRVRNIWATETGVEAGQGGFAWGMGAGVLPSDAVWQWLSYNDRVQRAPLVVDGVSYTSPFRGAAIFTYEGGGWAGYWFPLGQAAWYWRGDALALTSTPPPSWGAFDVAPPYVIPPRKVLVREGAP